MDILMLNETEVQRLLDLDALLNALAEGFRALSEGLAVAPKRNEVSVPNTGFLLAMPAYQQGREVTVKLVSVFHGNERLGERHRHLDGHGLQRRTTHSRRGPRHGHRFRPVLRRRAIQERRRRNWHKRYDNGCNFPDLDWHRYRDL